MTQRFVYVAYPIDYRGSVNPDFNIGSFLAKIEYAKSELMRTGTGILFDPGDAFTVNPEAKPGYEIARLNRQALVQMASGVIAFLPSGVPTVGVPMEIQNAISAGKWIAICTDMSKSWMLADFPGSSGDNPWIRVFDLTNEGVTGAVHWLNGQEGERFAPKESYLPVKVLAKGECGSNEPHEPHAYGEDMTDECYGMVNVLPSKAYPDDAGWDLVVARTTMIPANEFVDVDLGIAVELDPWTFGRVTGRSSTVRNHGLLVNEGIIDPGWRGPLFAGCWNLTDEDVIVAAGMRIAQLLIHGRDTNRIVTPVQHLSPSDRGTRGFGSSGS